MINIDRKIKDLLVKCNCLTKTPIESFHKSWCTYKKNKQKQKWVEQAADFMMTNSVGWSRENALDYCDSLYYTYIVEFGEEDISPEDAVLEDMSYWE